MIRDKDSVVGIISWLFLLAWHFWQPQFKKEFFFSGKTKRKHFCFLFFPKVHNCHRSVLIVSPCPALRPIPCAVHSSFSLDLFSVIVVWWDSVVKSFFTLYWLGFSEKGTTNSKTPFCICVLIIFQESVNSVFFQWPRIFSDLVC